MTSLILLTGMVIGVAGMAIALLFIFMSNTIIIKNEEGPELSSPYKHSMEIETVAEGLSFPTSMEFIDNENILVLEKDQGTIRLVSSWNRTLEKESVLKLKVDNEAERGLLGVAILKDNNVRNKKYSNNNNDNTSTGSINNESTPKVFLYFTEKSENENENRQQFPRNKV